MFRLKKGKTSDIRKFKDLKIGNIFFSNYGKLCKEYLRNAGISELEELNVLLGKKYTQLV